jgi:hypothetical protein
MTWLLIGALIWIALAVPAALLIGRGIRVAEAKRAVPPSDALDADLAATFGTSQDASAGSVEQPWTGPTTVPFTPTQRPKGSDRTTVPRPRPPVIRAPIRPSERDPGSRDSGPA